MLPVQLTRPNPRICFLQNPNDLLFRKMRLLQAASSPLPGPKNLAPLKFKYWGFAVELLPRTCYRIAADLSRSVFRVAMFEPSEVRLIFLWEFIDVIDHKPGH
jgi:hypothetical protein